MTDSWRRVGPGRGGFTLIEIIVALAVMLILAATITPSVLGILDKERVEKGAAVLANLAGAVAKFKSDVTKNPSRLSELAELITTQKDNSCGARFSTGEAGNWNGPYINRVISAGGLAMEFGTAQDLMVRVPATAAAAGSAGILQIVVTGVSEQDATALNDQVDGDNSSTLGTVRWSAPSNGYVELYYTMAISGC